MSETSGQALPSQRGRRAVVTGATGGLGYEVALALAAAGAEVVLAGRNPAKGEQALQHLRAVTPRAQVRFELLDLAELASVTAFAARLRERGEALDILVNNAGVMSLPRRELTADGFERQLGTNYLGHYALTARLLPLLRQARSARVVQVSSMAHRGAKIRLDDLQGAQRYQPWAAYGQSKLAMLMFALELQRRSDAAGWGLISSAAHPGWARTELIANGPAADGRRPLAWFASRLAEPWFSQSAADGALPILLALAQPAGGGYYGPGGFAELKGPPGVARIMPQALDVATAAALWQASARLVDMEFGDA